MDFPIATNIRENTHKEQATRIAQWLTLRVTSPQRRSGSFAVRALGLPFSTGGEYPTNGATARSTRSSSDDSRLSRNGQLALDRNSTRCTHARAPSPLRANWADASTCGRTPNVCSRRRTEPSPPRARVDCRWGCVLRCPRAGSVRTRRITRTISTPDGAGLHMSKGRAVAPPLSRATDKPTAENIRIDVGVRCAHDLGSGSGGTCSSRCRRRSSRVKPSKRLVREHPHPAEVERVEPAKRRAVSKRGHAAFCIRRESADSFVHGSLVGGCNEGLCASGRVWARGSRGGQLIERGGGEAADPTI